MRYNVVQYSVVCCSVVENAVCRSVLQCVAVCFSVLLGALLLDSTVAECSAGTHYSTLQRTAAHYNTLQHTSTHCNALQHTATHCNTLHHTAAHCTKCIATRFSILQRTATHCRVMQSGSGAVCWSVLECVAVYCVQ